MLAERNPVVVYHQPGDTLIRFTANPEFWEPGAVNPVTLTFVPDD